MLTSIAGHVSLNLEGEGSSIRKVLALAKDQKAMMQSSYDFRRTATIQDAVRRPPPHADEDHSDIHVDEEWDDVRSNDI